MAFINFKLGQLAEYPVYIAIMTLLSLTLGYSIQTPILCIMQQFIYGYVDIIGLIATRLYCNMLLDYFLL